MRPTEASLVIKAQIRKWRTVRKSRMYCKILTLEPYFVCSAWEIDFVAVKLLSMLRM